MHLHNNYKHTVLMAPDQTLSRKLNSLGINVINSTEIKQLPKNERHHADMQLCIIGNTAFVPVDCTEFSKELTKLFGYNTVICETLGEKYPNNVSLNVALIGNNLLCKASAIAKEIAQFCAENDINIINVNQGYTKCSTLILNEKAIISADITICKAAKEAGVEALQITPGYIYLDNADYGFIGGCSGRIGDTVYFFGDINTHPNAEQITKFIEKQNMNCVCLTSGPLKDIGGFVLIK